MSNETDPFRSQVDQHFELLEQRLGNVPELQPAFEIVDTNPGHVYDVYMGYIDLIDRMVDLDQDQISSISRAQTVLADRNGNVGSASKVGANDILAALGKQKELLIETAVQSTNPDSPYYDKAVEVLVQRMEGGHQLALSGGNTSDADPDSLVIIWGHTVITGPEALLHFVTCHYLERYLAEALTAQGIELARQKDFFLNALTDVVIVDRLSSDTSNAIFDLWALPKDQGGLGWITQDRLGSYTKLSDA